MNVDEAFVPWFYTKKKVLVYIFFGCLTLNGLEIQQIY
jgi:hypothetical protein